MKSIAFILLFLGLGYGIGRTIEFVTDSSWGFVGWGLFCVAYIIIWVIGSAFYLGRLCKHISFDGREEY